MEIKDHLQLASPASKAAADYRAHGSTKFKEHLRDHLANGYVVSTPGIFAMFKAVALDEHEGGLETRIAWYVSYARGDLRQLLAHVPFSLPWIAFKRLRRGRERLRIYPFDRFSQICNLKAPN